MRKFELYLALSSLFVDVLAITAALALAYGLRSANADIYFWSYSKYLSFVLWMIPVWVIIFASQGLYSVKSYPKKWSAFMKILIGLITGWGVFLIFLYMWRSPESQVFPRLAIVYGVVLTAIFTMTGRLLTGSLSSFMKSRSLGLIKTVVVGSKTNTISSSIRASYVHGRNLITELNPPWSEVVGKLKSLYRKEKFDEVILADPNIGEARMLPVIKWADTVGCAVTLVPSVLAVRTANVEVGSLANSPVLFIKKTPLEGWGLVYKRVFDILVGSILIIILSPFYVLVSLLVYLTSPGPLLFRQERVGQDDKLVSVYKFRSMYVDADKRFKDFNGWSTDEDKDPRVTPIGRFIRKSNLDELPQLFSIVRGTMSLVGPRPEQPGYVKKFSKEVPGYVKRHYVKAGLTGWAQVNGLRGDTSIPERVKYDLYYIENWSIWFDLRIILSTVLIGAKQIWRKNA